MPIGNEPEGVLQVHAPDPAGGDQQLGFRFLPVTLHSQENKLQFQMG
jgi:hypothetical protein